MPPKPPLTHFLCLPLVTQTSRPQLQASISRFTTEVTTANDATITSLPPKAVRSVGAIHFTIGVMSLPTPERLEAACSLLRDLDVLDLLKQAEASVSTSTSKEYSIGTQEITTSDKPPQPLKISLSGLHPMQAPTKTSSLYTAPTLSPRSLTPFSLALQTAFRTPGFLLPDTRPLKLHATIVNTIYARSATSGKKRWSKDSGKIDATALIERYRDYEWVRDMRIERVAICEMGAKKVLEGEVVVDQVYTEVASVELP